jgi:hypothetical protein
MVLDMIRVRREMPTGTYGREAVIPPHILYLLVTKGVTPALLDVCAGRKREVNVPTIAKIDLFCAL